MSTPTNSSTETMTPAEGGETDLLTRLRFALYRYGGHIPPCPGRPCECGFLAEWRAAKLPATALDALRIALLKPLDGNKQKQPETNGSPLTLDEQGTWNADGSKDWWQPTWERRTAVSYGEKAETFVPLTLLTEALGLLQRARYFTPESDPPALTHEINNFLGTFGIAAKGYSPVPKVDGLPIYVHVGNVIGPDEEGDVLVDWDSEAYEPKVGTILFVRLWTQAEIDAAHKAGEELFQGLNVNVDGDAVKANDIPTQEWLDKSQGLTGLEYDEHGERLSENGDGNHG